MKKYTIELSDVARQDLRGIYEYVAITLLEPGIAAKLTNNILKELDSLKTMPDRCPIFHVEPWKSRKLHRLNINNHSAFFQIEGQCVQIIRIIYGGRDIESVLREEK